MSYTFEVRLVLNDYDEDEEDYSCDFIIVCGTVRAELHYSEPYCVTRANWRELAENLFNPEYKKRLVFCDSNGVVSVTLKEGFLTFHTSKYGAGGAGSFDISIRPTRHVQEELKKLYLQPTSPK